MRFVHLYLIGYCLLVIGALAALWYGGVLQRISGVWILIGLIIAVGLGVMMSITAGKPEITRD
jgi:4-hydroxybenzoate polyprenyltransferase